MNLSTAMTFPFQREGGWDKIIIGGVFVLILIIGWFSYRRLRAGAG